MNDAEKTIKNCIQEDNRGRFIVTRFTFFDDNKNEYKLEKRFYIKKRTSYRSIVKTLSLINYIFRTEEIITIDINNLLNSDEDSLDRFLEKVLLTQELKEMGG